MVDDELRDSFVLGIGQRILTGTGLAVFREPSEGIVAVEVVAERCRGIFDVDTTERKSRKS